MSFSSILRSITKQSRNGPHKKNPRVSHLWSTYFSYHAPNCLGEKSKARLQWRNSYCYEFVVIFAKTQSNDAMPLRVSKQQRTSLFSRTLNHPRSFKNTEMLRFWEIRNGEKSFNDPPAFSLFRSRFSTSSSTVDPSVGAEFGFMNEELYFSFSRRKGSLKINESYFGSSDARVPVTRGPGEEEKCRHCYGHTYTFVWKP